MIARIIPFTAGWLLGIRSHSITALLYALIAGVVFALVFEKLFSKPAKDYLQ